VVVNEAVVLTVAGHAPDAEWNPGWHGKVIVVVEAANAATGGALGRIAGSRL
jgi:hypothetical protein